MMEADSRETPTESTQSLQQTDRERQGAGRGGRKGGRGFRNGRRQDGQYDSSTDKMEGVHIYTSYSPRSGPPKETRACLSDVSYYVIRETSQLQIQGLMKEREREREGTGSLAQPSPAATIRSSLVLLPSSQVSLQTLPPSSLLPPDRCLKCWERAWSR